LNIVNYVYGYCEFIAEGYFPERFLNLSARTDMGLWDIHRTDMGLQAKITARRYKKLLPIARKCGLRLRVVKKCGLPFKMLPYRRRAGMPLGFLLFCGIIWLLSQFYWIVDLPQVSPGFQSKLEDAIYNSGIRPGVLRSQVNASMIADELQLELGELAWAGISTSGSYISVDVREMEKLNQIVTNDQPCNIVAARDGIIISIKAANGQTEVIAGQAVSKGDLLISGVMEFSSGDISMVHAQGEVIATTFYEFTSEVPYEQHRTERTGKLITIRRLMLLGMEIPLYIGSNPDGQFEREYDEWQLEIGGTPFPLITRTERWFELQTVNRLITPQEAESIAYKNIEEQMKSIQSIEIISRTESLVHTDSGVTLTVMITAKENIALAELILFD